MRAGLAADDELCPDAADQLADPVQFFLAADQVAG